MLPGYSSIVDQKSKERYANKLNYVNGIDPLALAKKNGMMMSICGLL